MVNNSFLFLNFYCCSVHNNFFSTNSSGSNGTNIKVTYSNSNTTFENNTEASDINNVSISEYGYGSEEDYMSEEYINQLVFFCKILKDIFIILNTLL